MNLLSTWRARFIASFLLLQLFLPLRYYLAARDPNDERWAWRMFSPTRMTRCTPDFVMDGRHVNLGTEFHEAWVELAGRGRLAVLDAMGRELCDRHPTAALEVTMTCSYLDGSRKSFASRDGRVQLQLDEPATDVCGRRP